MQKKICNKCGIEKDVCEFGVQNNKKDKLRSSCKECRKIEGILYRQNNKEKRELTKKNWRNRNLDYDKNYYLKNRERRYERQKDWNKKNKERLKKARKQWKENNKEKMKNYHNDRIKHQRKTDPIKKLIFNVRCRVSSILKNKKDKTFEIVGCTPEFLREFLSKKFTEGMTWENQGQWHIDHIIPLSSAKTEEEIYKLCHYTNLQPLWAEDNLKKSNKILY